MINLTFLFLTIAKYTQGTTLLQSCPPISIDTSQSLEITTSINFQSHSQIFFNPIIMDGQNQGEQAEAPKFNKINIRGGPGKIQAVLKSASDAQAARDAYANEHEVADGVEIRGGPGKAEGVMESAASDGEGVRPEVRGGPGKVEGVLGSAGEDEEQTKPEIRGGPGKAQAVMDSAAEGGNGTE
jgi:hypothetical protein